MSSSAPQWPDDGSARPGDAPEAGGPHPARGAASARPGAAGKATGGTGGGERPLLRVVPPVAPGRGQPARRPPTAGARAGEWSRLAGLREPTERDLAAARLRARPHLPSPVAVTRGVAMALLEVEAGCRSAAQIERICSPELWARLERRIGRRGGPLPTGRSVLSVRCQENRPGVADTVVVVRRGERMLPVAMRLDAAAGRWTVTELRWWCTEHDAEVPSCRGGRGEW
jgi:Family of unknown function (DUF6459)